MARQISTTIHLHLSDFTVHLACADLPIVFQRMLVGAHIRVTSLPGDVTFSGFYVVLFFVIRQRTNIFLKCDLPFSCPFKFSFLKGHQRKA